ncbi:MAG: hypothetical protein LIP01_03920, partial [Tannerellaceae bacterium]|nr:hypothetical protein [Tannerellaceae bacterium]
VFLSYSLAKVDVWVSGEASNNFKLKTVRVYCPNLEGFLFPGFYSADKINAANIYSTPIRYTLADEDTSQELLNTIYIFERMDNPTLQENQKEYEMLCLVVGGRFDEDLYTTYYRVDFKHKDDKEEDVYYPIQRNDHFLVNITKVKESGWPDEELAFYGSEKI